MLYLASELRFLLAYRPERARVENARDYETQVDPWRYSSAWGVEQLRTVREILDRCCGSKRLGRVLDVGCGEGWVSETLSERCDFLLGVDVVDIALARARERCRAWPHVHFQEWDLLKGLSLGRFDLILLMGVLECFSRTGEFRVAREKVIAMLEPGALLLATTARQSDVFDTAWWGRWLPRGALQINQFLARDPRLTIVDEITTGTHRFTLYRRSE